MKLVRLKNVASGLSSRLRGFDTLEFFKQGRDFYALQYFEHSDFHILMKKSLSLRVIHVV